MEKEVKVVLGIAFLGTIMSGSFSLLDRLTVIFLGNSLVQGLGIFCARSSLWFIIVVGIIVILYNLNKKHNQRLSDMLQDKTISVTSGVLVGISGLIHLSSYLPVILSIISSLKILRSGALIRNIIINSVCFLIDLCQILFGVYMLKYFKSKNE